MPPRCCPCLYIGVGRKAEGGWRARVRGESAEVGEDWLHAHGIAMYATSAVPVGGMVTLSPRPLGWVDGRVAEKDVARVGRLMGGLDDDSVLAAAERIAIRLSIQLGYTVTPVNSQFATAWKDRSDHDVAAVAAADRLRELSA